MACQPHSSSQRNTSPNPLTLSAELKKNFRQNTRVMTRRIFKLGKQSCENKEQDKSLGFTKTKCPAQSKKGFNTDSQENKKKNKFAEANKLLKNDLNSIQNYRALLPYYLNAKLPAHFNQIQKISSKIDQYLAKIPQNQTGDSFLNVCSYLDRIECISLNYMHLEQINFIVPGFYNLYQDPLNNLIIQIPRGQSIHIRQQTIRRQMYKHFVRMQKLGKQNDTISTSQIRPKKINYFYEKKKFRPTQQRNKHTKALNQFISEVLTEVTMKQAQQERLLENQNCYVNEEQRREIKIKIKEIYMEKKVSNIYKATLIELLTSETDMSIEKVLKSVESILEQNQLVQEIIMKERVIIGLKMSRE